MPLSSPVWSLCLLSILLWNFAWNYRFVRDMTKENTKCCKKKNAVLRILSKQIIKSVNYIYFSFWQVTWWGCQALKLKYKSVRVLLAFIIWSYQENYFQVKHSILLFNDPNCFEMPLSISYWLIFLYNYGYGISYIKYITLTNLQLTCLYRGTCSKSEISSSVYKELIITLVELALNSVQKMWSDTRSLKRG